MKGVHSAVKGGSFSSGSYGGHGGKRGGSNHVSRMYAAQLEKGDEYQKAEIYVTDHKE